MAPIGPALQLTLMSVGRVFTLLQNRDDFVFDPNLVEEEDIEEAIEDTGFEEEILAEPVTAGAQTQATLAGQFPIGEASNMFQSFISNLVLSAKGISQQLTPATEISQIEGEGGKVAGEREIDTLLIQPGDTSQVLPGSSYVNESMVTSATVPVSKKVISQEMNPFFSTAISSDDHDRISLPWYQVFINFRGDELRNSFVSFLAKAMRLEKINVFTDEAELRGTNLKYLFRRIEESRVAVAIFSERYTESSWCLDELVKMKEQMEQDKLVVIPVFYRLDATKCKRFMGAFGDNFRDLAWQYRSEPERINKWEEALSSVFNNIGLKSDMQSNESKFVDSIVEEVKKVLVKIFTEEKRSLIRAPPSGEHKERFTNQTFAREREEFDHSTPTFWRRTRERRCIYLSDSI